MTVIHILYSKISYQTFSIHTHIYTTSSTSSLTCHRATVPSAEARWEQFSVYCSKQYKELSVIVFSRQHSVVMQSKALINAMRIALHTSVLNWTFRFTKYLAVSGWIDGWMDDWWFDRWIDGWVEVYVDWSIVGWVDGLLDEWMDEWVDG